MAASRTEVVDALGQTHLALKQICLRAASPRTRATLRRTPSSPQTAAQRLRSNSRLYTGPSRGSVLFSDVCVTFFFYFFFLFGDKKSSQYLTNRLFPLILVDYDCGAEFIVAAVFDVV